MSIAGVPNCILLRDGRFDKANGSTEDDLKRIFAGFAERRPDKLVLHFHGGLVSREDALASGRRLSPAYQECGAESLFVVWESGILEVVSQKLPRIFQENLFQTIHVKVSQFVKAKLEQLLQPEGSRSTHLPTEFEQKIQEEIDKGPVCSTMSRSRRFPPMR